MPATLKGKCPLRMPVRRDCLHCSWPTSHPAPLAPLHGHVSSYAAPQVALAASWPCRAEQSPATLLSPVSAARHGTAGGDAGTLHCRRRGGGTGRGGEGRGTMVSRSAWQGPSGTPAAGPDRREHTYLGMRNYRNFSQTIYRKLRRKTQTLVSNKLRNFLDFLVCLQILVFKLCRKQS